MVFPFRMRFFQSDLVAYKPNGCSGRVCCCNFLRVHADSVLVIAIAPSHCDALILPFYQVFRCAFIAIAIAMTLQPLPLPSLPVCLLFFRRPFLPYCCCFWWLCSHFCVECLSSSKLQHSISLILKMCVFYTIWVH